jgi:hypothetical protein
MELMVRAVIKLQGVLQELAIMVVDTQELNTRGAMHIATAVAVEEEAILEVVGQALVTCLIDLVEAAGALAS